MNLNGRQSVNIILNHEYAQTKKIKPASSHNQLYQGGKNEAWSFCDSSLSARNVPRQLTPIRELNVVTGKVLALFAPARHTMSQKSDVCSLRVVAANTFRPHVSGIVSSPKFGRIAQQHHFQFHIRSSFSPRSVRFVFSPINSSWPKFQPAIADEDSQRRPQLSLFQLFFAKLVGLSKGPHYRRSLSCWGVAALRDASLWTGLVRNGIR